MNLSDFFTGSETTLASIIIPLVTGVIIAACAVLFNKQIIGKFVKRLFDENADSEQNAKTLEGAWLSKKPNPSLFSAGRFHTEKGRHGVPRFER